MPPKTPPKRSPKTRAKTRPAAPEAATAKAPAKPRPTRTPAPEAEERPQDGPGPKSIRIQRAMLAHIVLGHTEEEAIAAVSGKAGLMWQDEAVRCSRERAEAELLALGRVLALRHDDPAFHERLIGSTSEALQRIAKLAEGAGQFAAAREALMARVRLHSVRSERFSRLAPGRDDHDSAPPVGPDEDAHTRTAREFASLTDEELEARARSLSARSAMFNGNREQG